MVRKRFSHYSCCKLRDLGGKENWSKSGGQWSSKMALKSSFGHPGVRLLRFGLDLIEVRFLIIFWAAQKLKKEMKKWGGGVKTESLAQGSAEHPGSPKSFWSLQIKQSHAEFAMSLGRPVPCEQGAADLWATASSADLQQKEML